MPLLDFKIDFSKIEQIAQGLPKNFDAGVQGSQRQLIALGNDILLLMRKEGSPIRSPVQWDSPLQRKAYFATKGFGKGIPYKRKGKYINSWELIPIQGGMRLINTDPKATFVAGRLTARGGLRVRNSQSRIHIGRWPAFHDAVVSVLARWKEGGWSRIRKDFLNAFRADFRKNRAA